MNNGPNRNFYDRNGLPFWVQQRVDDNQWPIEVCQCHRSCLAHGRPGFARQIVSPHNGLKVHTLESMTGWYVLTKRELEPLSDGRRRWAYEPRVPVEWSHWEI